MVRGMGAKIIETLSNENKSKKQQQQKKNTSSLPLDDLKVPKHGVPHTLSTFLSYV